MEGKIELETVLLTLKAIESRTIVHANKILMAADKILRDCVEHCRLSAFQKTPQYINLMGKHLFYVRALRSIAA